MKILRLASLAQDDRGEAAQDDRGAGRPDDAVGAFSAPQGADDRVENLNLLFMLLNLS